MARSRDTYSRFVAWLKILLPLIALAVLGTVFLFTSENSIETGFTFSRADMALLEAGSFIKNPQIEGQTTKGEPFFLKAEEVRPRDGNASLLDVTGLNGAFSFESGGAVKIDATEALIDMQAQTVLFESGGHIETSDGNIAEFSTMLVNLNTGDLGGTKIEANGPLGQISADRFRIESNADENHVLWFENNVRMLYDY